MSRKISSGFMYANPSFLSGVARTLDIFGVYDDYNMSTSAAEADACAIASDWIITGQDIKDTMDEFPPEQEAAA